MKRSYKEFEESKISDFVLFADKYIGIDILYCLKWTNNLPAVVYVTDDIDKETAGDLSYEFSIPVMCLESGFPEITKPTLFGIDISNRRMISPLIALAKTDIDIFLPESLAQFLSNQTDIQSISDCILLSDKTLDPIEKVIAAKEKYASENGHRLVLPPLEYDDTFDVNAPRFKNIMDERKERFKDFDYFVYKNDQPFAVFCSSEKFVETFRILTETYQKTPKFIIIPDSDDKTVIPVKCMYLSEFLDSHIKIGILYAWDLNNYDYTRYLIKLGASENTFFIGSQIIGNINFHNTLLPRLCSYLYFCMATEIVRTRYIPILMSQGSQFSVYFCKGKFIFNGLFLYEINNIKLIDNKKPITINLIGTCHAKFASEFFSENYNLFLMRLGALNAYREYYNIININYPSFDYRVILIDNYKFFDDFENNEYKMFPILDKYESLFEKTIFYLMPNIYVKKHLTETEQKCVTDSYGKHKEINSSLEILLRSRYTNFFSGKHLVADRTDNIFIDLVHFVDHKFYKHIADDIDNIIQTLEKYKEMQNTEKYAHQFKTRYFDDLKSALSDSLIGIDKYCRELFTHIKYGKNGAIVMNCNPFTYGHRYIIEYAAKQVDNLYIFVVEEDKSYFPFTERFEMVKEGTVDLENVEVLPSGKFIISSLTFEEYFSKAEALPEEKPNTLMDIVTFALKIAPALNITVRFAGEEPLDPVTKAYNDEMTRVLPQYDIDFVEIKRKEDESGVISASRVRELIAEKRLEKIKTLVPETTFLRILK
jgi:[citrate (pro-3S)-lyase] ligase